MNIVLISDQFPPINGGAEGQADRLCAELARQGHEVRALTGRWRGSLTAREARDGFTIERLDTLNSFGGIRGLRRFGQDLFAFNLRRRLLALSAWADVFHAIFVRRGAAIAVQVGQETGTPVLVKETSGGARSFEEILQHPRGRWMREHFYRNLRHVAVMNEQAAEEYSGLPFDDLTVHLAFNGIDADSDTPRWQPAKDPEILFLGRIRGEKGWVELLEAFTTIAPEFPEWKLSYCGGGPELEDLRARVAALRLEDRVHAAGPTSEPLARLSRATLMAQTSYTEGMSNTVLEAMLVGTPSVVTRAGANEAMLGPDCAWFADSPAPEHIAAALRSAMADPSGRTERSIRSQDRVRSRFSMAASATRYLEIYREIGAGA